MKYFNPKKQKQAYCHPFIVILVTSICVITAAWANPAGLIAEAGPDISFNDTDSNGTELITLNGSGSVDSYGTITSYSWRKNGVLLASGIKPSVFFAVGVHTVTLTITNEQGASASDDVTVAVNIVEGNAVETVPDPPQLAKWEADMHTFGQQHGLKLGQNLEDGNTNSSLSCTYYDAARVFYQIADYTGDPVWNTYAGYAITAYGANYVIPNNGGTPGYWNFSKGLRMDYERTGDVASQNAAILLSQKAAYAKDSTPLTWTVGSNLSREVAYAIHSYIDAELLGEPRRGRLAGLFEQALGHLDQFLAAGDSTDYAPFMFALTAEALIRYYYHVNKDARIVAKIAPLADWTWTNAWVAQDQSFWYRATNQSRGSPDLNLLIAPVYAWLYHQTGNIQYRDQADQIFEGGVKGAWLNGAKQFNQNYRFSFDYITWRRSVAGVSPVVALVGSNDLSLRPGEIISLTFLVSDADGDNLSFSVEPSDFATLTNNNDDTVTLTLTPTSSDLGNHTFVVTATDPRGLADSASVDVRVIFNSTTRYVATTGSDSSGDGTENNPWASITHATNNCNDGDTILVKPGMYNGLQRLQGQWTEGVTIRSEIPYQAQLRHSSTVVTCWYGQNITFEGFDVAHDGPGASPLVMHVQNLNGASNPVQNIVIRNNIFHDSYNNDLLKINNGAIYITVEGNMFYNQQGNDEHIDINSVAGVIVQDNIFFNDFPGSFRGNSASGSFIVVKDSNGSSDVFLGARQVTLRRNVMLNYTGSIGSYFILFGGDGAAYPEASDCLVENNLLLGNSSKTMRAPFGIKGCSDITFRHNTIVGNTPANAFAMRCNREGSNLQVDNIRFYNNAWSDPTGTMDDFSDTVVADNDTLFVNLSNNAYWNDGNSIPSDSSDLVNYTDDPSPVFGNPLFSLQANLIIPRWQAESNQFADGSATIAAAFQRLVALYGTPANNSALIDSANPAYTATEDILGKARPTGNFADIGAFEYVPTVPTQTYATWLAAYNPALVGDDARPDADPDGNGISNFHEYAFDFDSPSSFDNMVPLNSMLNNGSEQWVTLTWRRNNFASDLVYEVEYSHDLSSWSPVVIDGVDTIQTILYSNVDTDSSATLVETKMNVSSTNGIFLRLNVEKID